MGMIVCHVILACIIPERMAVVRYSRPPCEQSSRLAGEKTYSGRNATLTHCSLPICADRKSIHIATVADDHATNALRRRFDSARCAEVNSAELMMRAVQQIRYVL